MPAVRCESGRLRAGETSGRSWRRQACALVLGLALLALGAQAGMAQLQDPEIGESPAMEPARCWVGLDEFERTTDLDVALDFIRRAMLEDDPELHAYLGRHLATLIGNDTEKALQVLAAARGATNESEMRLLMGALGNAEAATDPALLEPLLQAAEQDLGSLFGGLALQTLKHQPTLDQAAVERVTALAHEPYGNAGLAVATLGDVMATAHLKHGEDHGRYLKPLLDIAESNTLEPHMNVFALEMPSYADPLYSPAEIERLAAVMQDNPEPRARINAAHLLGAQGNKDTIRDEFRRAFAGEPSFCVRYVMMFQIARALGPDIVPFLEWAVGVEPRLAQDLQDYRDIYGRGEVDYDRVFLQKPFRFHQCESHPDYESE